MPEIDNAFGGLPEEAGKVRSEQVHATTQISLTEEQIRTAHVGELIPLAGPIHLVDYDPEWPRIFAVESTRIESTLGDRVLLKRCVREPNRVAYFVDKELSLPLRNREITFICCPHDFQKAHFSHLDNRCSWVGVQFWL